LRRDAIYVCGRCDYQSAKWLGRCPECGGWGTIESRARTHDRSGDAPAPLEPLPFSAIRAADAERLLTGINELDRVLGGGLVPGAVVLLGGEPGIGKSTLLLQAAAAFAAASLRVLYLSGEESAAQLRLRGDRLGVEAKDLLVLAETDVDRSIETARRVGPAVLVVDSIQAVRCPDLDSIPGSTTQVRAAATRFAGFAKETGTPVVLVGHVTKDGAIAGPRTLEHLVDAVIHFEGDRHHTHRILRALKNRFGSTDELGVFRMEDRGLAEVANPSELFVDHRTEQVQGSAVLPAIVGSRPLLVEVQALVGEVTQGSPRRTALGIETSRLAMVLAVLQRVLGPELANRDVFANAAGGVCVAEPAADLAVASAIASSVRRHPLPARCVVMGEIGLTTEIRPVSRVETRLREAARLGFTTALVPDRGTEVAVDGMTTLRAATLAQALDLLFEVQS